MKKAMAVSQIFTYLLGMIVISVTILIGYKAIGKVANIQPQIDDFKLNMGVLVNDIANEYQTFKKERISLPGKIKYICYANSNINENYEDINIVIPEDVLSFDELPNKVVNTIQASLNDGAEENVFMITNKLEESFYIKNLEIDDKDDPGSTVLCIQNLNGIEVVLRGYGNRARIHAACETDNDCLGGMNCDCPGGDPDCSVEICLNP